ncbi:MAG: hypothetical protein Q8N26_06425 [Myxococcales bacterium]|nr:hypothetical protein [Myxococcales bacterium]
MIWLDSADRCVKYARGAKAVFVFCCLIVSVSLGAAVPREKVCFSDDGRWGLIP